MDEPVQMLEDVPPSCFGGPTDYQVREVSDAPRPAWGCSAGGRMNRQPRPRPTLDDVRTGARFVFRAARLLRRRVTSEEAHAVLRARLAHREANLLAMVQEGIYANAISPYRRLLELAGCEYGDVQRLVQTEG